MPHPVISTKAKRSGEISLRNVASSIVAGDLSTLRFMRAQSLCPIPARSSARDDDACGQHTVISRETNWPKRCPAPRHFDESEAERRNLTPKCSKPMVAGDLSTLRFMRAQSLCPIPTRSSARDDTAPVISTVAKRSGEISLRSVANSIVAGDLWALRFNKVQSFCHPYRQVPLEMTPGWRLAIRISHQKRAVEK